MSTSADEKKDETLDTQAVNNLLEYLRIRSVHPNINYDACLKFIEKQANDLQLPFKVYTVAPNKPVAVITWTGTHPHLSSILLNSHMDVVPVFEEEWTHKPFDAVIDEMGNIYGRGTQDMKGITVQYFEAIKRLKLEDKKLKRTVHMTFVPDEEIGGEEGMKLFVKRNEFKDLNAGFVIDEGMGSGKDNYIVSHGEKCIWHIFIHCPGATGHGSLLLDNTAGEKAAYILNKFYEFRQQEKQKLTENPNLKIGDVTSVNLTILQGGVQTNVVPPEFIIAIDCRVAVTVDIQKFEDTINEWCKQAGKDVWIEFLQKQPLVPLSNLDDSNVFWTAFKQASDELNMEIEHHILPAATDSRYIRELGIPAIGFTTITNTPIRAHDHDEYLGVEMFLKGIGIYSKLITAIANVDDITG